MKSTNKSGISKCPLDFVTEVRKSRHHARRMHLATRANRWTTPFTSRTQSSLTRASRQKWKYIHWKSWWRWRMSSDVVAGPAAESLNALPGQASSMQEQWHSEQTDNEGFQTPHHFTGSKTKTYDACHMPIACQQMRVIIFRASDCPHTKCSPRRPWPSRSPLFRITLCFNVECTILLLSRLRLLHRWKNGGGKLLSWHTHTLLWVDVWTTL